MSFIDGIGDEVTQFLLGLLLVIIVAVAWWSTNTRDSRSIRSVYLLDYRIRMLRDYQRTYQTARQNSAAVQQHRQTQASVSNSTSATSTDIDDPLETRTARSSVALTPVTVSRLSRRNDTTIHEPRPQRPESTVEPQQAHEQQPEPELTAAEREAERERASILQVMDADESEVRRRRLAFFSGRREESNIDNTNASPIEPAQLTANETAATINTEVEEAVDDDSDEEDSSFAESNVYEGEYDNREIDSTIMEHNYAELPIIDNRTITIKIKYTTDEMKVVTGKLQERLGDFKKRHFAVELNNDKTVRLIFNGKILNDDHRTIAGCGIFHNCVVHCLVVQRRPDAADGNPGDIRGESANSGNIGGPSDPLNMNPHIMHLERQQRSQGTQHQQGQQREWDFGNTFSRCTNLILVFAWYLRYSVPHIWTMTATLCLVALTGFSLIAHVGVFIPGQEQPRPPAGVAPDENGRPTRLNRAQ